MKAICHPDRKKYCKDLCRTCYERKLREDNPEYAERQRENSRNWYKNNKKRKAEWDKNYRLNHKIDPENKYLSMIKYKLGVTKEEYDELLSNCKNKCQICGTL